MNIDHDEGNDADPFGQKLFSFQQDGDVYEAVVVGRSGQYLGILLVTGKGQRYTYRVLQTIQIELLLLCVWAEPAGLGSAKTALKFKYEI